MKQGGIKMKDNIIIETIEFSQELYEKNVQQNIFKEEYEGGEENANNECNNAKK